MTTTTEPATGYIDVLSVGRGDVRVNIDPTDPDGIERARTMITDLLNRGATILVETDDGPVRVKRFNAKRMAYIIADLGTPAATPETSATAKPAARKRASRKTTDREVPAAKAKATLVGRTAGG